MFFYVLCFGDSGSWEHFVVSCFVLWGGMLGNVVNVGFRISSWSLVDYNFVNFYLYASGKILSSLAQSTKFPIEFNRLSMISLQLREFFSWILQSTTKMHPESTGK